MNDDRNADLTAGDGDGRIDEVLNRAGAGWRAGQASVAAVDPGLFTVRPRRSAMVSVAAAAAVLLIAGGVYFALPRGGNDQHAAAGPAISSGPTSTVTATPIPAPGAGVIDCGYFGDDPGTLSVTPVPVPGPTPVPANGPTERPTATVSAVPTRSFTEAPPAPTQTGPVTGDAPPGWSATAGASAPEPVTATGWPNAGGPGASSCPTIGIGIAPCLTTAESVPSTKPPAVKSERSISPSSSSTDATAVPTVVTELPADCTAAMTLPERSTGPSGTPTSVATQRLTLSPPPVPTAPATITPEPPSTTLTTPTS